MNRAAAACVLSILTALPAAANDVTVYRWIDRDGVPHYTDRPQEGANAAEATEIRSRRTDPAALQARVDARSDLEAARDTRRGQAAEDADAAEAERRETEARRSANCDRAREQLETYATARRLYRPLPDGEREYLSDDEMDAARASAQQAVREWCD